MLFTRATPLCFALYGLALACAHASSTGPVEPIPSSGDPIPAADIAAPQPTPDPPPPPPPSPDMAPAEDSVTVVDEDAALQVPLEELMALAVYAPDPDQKALQQTKAARFDKADGAAAVGFCVDTHGNTANIRSIQKFPDDPMIDQILRDTVARWRFKPWLADGHVVAVCTERRWNLRFK